MEDHHVHNHDGVGGMHVYMPWWLDNAKLDFPRGYHIEVYGGPGMPGSGFGGGIQRRNGGGYGKQLKADYRKYYGATIVFDGRGEMIPNENSYCELDPNVVANEIRRRKGSQTTSNSASKTEASIRPPTM